MSAGVSRFGWWQVGERPHPDADGDALSKGVVLRLGEALAQEGLAGEDEGEGILLLEAVGGEQSQILERRVGQEVRLVEDDDGALGQPAEVDDELMRRLALEAAGAQADFRDEGGEQAEPETPSGHSCPASANTAATSTSFATQPVHRRALVALAVTAAAALAGVSSPRATAATTPATTSGWYWRCGYSSPERMTKSLHVLALHLTRVTDFSTRPSSSRAKTWREPFHVTTLGGQAFVDCSLRFKSSTRLK